jgi:hypothetical protein
MTNQIQLSTKHGQVLVELLDTEFVHFWKTHYDQMVDCYSLTPRHVPWPNYQPCSHETVDTLIDRILNVIKTINSSSYLCPLPEIVTKDQLSRLDLSTQQLLNRLHRYAVVATEFGNRWHHNGQEEFNPVPYTNDEFMYNINVLNQSIHYLEEYVITPHKQEFLRQVQTVEFVFESSKYQDVDVFLDGSAVAIPDEMQQHLRLSGYDVWIKKDLLGKDFITAFADHDDPAQFDIRPPPTISGGIAIDLDQGRDNLFDSPLFAAWLGQSPNDTHGSYPLGKVISGKENLLKFSRRFW